MFTRLDNEITAVLPEEETLHTLVSKMERLPQRQGNLVEVPKEELDILCSSAIMVYETEMWHERGNKLLEEICETYSMDKFSGFMRRELEAWMAERKREAEQKKELGKKLERYKDGRREA